MERERERRRKKGGKRENHEQEFRKGKKIIRKKKRALSIRLELSSRDIMFAYSLMPILRIFKMGKMISF